MFITKQFPKISPVFENSSEHPIELVYDGPIRAALKQVCPADFFYDAEIAEEWIQEFHAQLPLVKWTEWGGFDEGRLSAILLCRHRPKVGKFFYDIISRWLLPGKDLNVALFFFSDFRMPEFGDELYTVAKMVICVEEPSDLEMIRSGLPIIETEIKIGVHSAYHANRILEIKGLSPDEKTSLIQERISALVQRRPKEFDYDIFSEMQHFLVMCREEFKAMREYEHMSRIVYVFYLFQKKLRQCVEEAPSKRHLILKLLKARLHLPLGIKKVLGVFVGLNLLKENEVFEERHLVKAIQSHIPGVRAIEDSYFVSENKEDRISTLYLEVEKEGNADFSLDEISKLRRALPEDLKGSVEQLVRPVFMPRNEEEVMRNIVTLSQQLRYSRDIPQVIISFDEQTDKDLSFTIILVRVLQSGTRSIQELFSQADSHLEFIPDRIKRVGLLRKKYPKEATVFRVKLPNSAFLRSDHSVDLYKARLEVVTELQRVIGEVRDFNGGMISKQIEVFLRLKNSLGELGRQNEFLLENFFHSIFPIELRSVIDAVPLKTLFTLLLDVVEGRQVFKTIKEPKRVFALASFHDFAQKQKLFEAVEGLNLRSPHLVSVDLAVRDAAYVGFIYFTDDEIRQDLFLKTLEQT